MACLFLILAVNVATVPASRTDAPNLSPGQQNKCTGHAMGAETNLHPESSELWLDAVLDAALARSESHPEGTHLKLKKTQASYLDCYGRRSSRLRSGLQHRIGALSHGQCDREANSIAAALREDSTQTSEIFETSSS